MQEIDLKGLNETIFYEKLNNGLRVYMWVNNKVNTFYATLSVKFGSIYNEFKVNNNNYKLPNGVAHFLEHVKFNENSNTTAHDYYNKMGCDTNAFTTFNYTNYQVFGSDNPKDNIEHLLDFVQNRYFTKKIINNEKGIIIEEANMGLDDPYTVMLFNHLANIFNTSSYKELITGNKEDIKSITLNDIENSFDYFYHPANMFLVVTGNFNPYEIIEMIKENQEKKEFPEYNNPKRVIQKESKKVNKEYEEVNINVSSRKIKIGIKIPKSSLSDFSDYQKRIYLSLLLKANFGSTSDFRDMLLKKELINNMGYMVDIFDEYIIIMFTIDSNYKDEIIELFNSALDNLKIDKKTFERMKKANIASLVLSFEDVEYVNSAIQASIMHYDDIISNVKEIQEKTNYQEIEKIIKKLDLKERSILVLNPLQ